MKNRSLWKLIIALLLIFGTTFFYTSALVEDISGYNQDIDLKKFEGSLIMSLNSDKAFVNGKEVLGKKVILQNGRTLVPLRFAAESFQAKVDWEPVEHKVTVTLGDKLVSLTIDSSDMYVDGRHITLDVPAKLHEGVTYLPLRAIFEALGKYVEYKNEYKFIVISNNVIDLNLTSLNTLKVAFDENYKVLYGDTWVIIAEKDERLYGWDLNNGDNFIDLGDNFSAARLKEGNVVYLSFHIGGNIMGSDQIFAIYPDKKVKFIYSTDLLDMKEKDGYLYMLVENNYRNLINDRFESMQNYSGNLIRMNINKAITYHETVKNNVPFQAEPLGAPGYFYGIYPIVGKYFDTTKTVVLGFGYLFDWELKNDGIYAVGVDFTSDQADQTIARYKIPFTGRSHVKIGEITTP